MANIDKTAVISKKAKIDSDVEIGPFCVIGDDVEIGSGSCIKSHVVIQGNSKIGKNNIIFPFAAIGQVPQDLKFGGEKSFIEIGDNNKIREHVTIHLGTKGDNLITKIGDNCLLMVASHVAHDCVVGDGVILANNATLAGHVKLEDNVIVGGLAAIHQFVRVGRGAMIGGMSGVENDVMPYSLVMGERASLAGLNLIGLKRKGFSREQIAKLREFYRLVFERSDKTFEARVKDAAVKFSGEDFMAEVINFLQQDSGRNICIPKK